MSIESVIIENLDIWTSAIKTKSASGRGSTNKLELYGIKKLRELILELAVRGKLVPQDMKEEPAQILLEKIQEEKEQLVKDKKLKKSKKLESILIDDFPFDVPKTWEFERLGNVVDIIRGITFPASAKESESSEENIACLRTANVQDAIDWDDLIYVDKSFVKRDDQFLAKYDIVMSMANSRELVGKVAFADSIPVDASFGGFLSVLRPRKLFPDFVMLFLRTPYARETLIGSASQTTNIANISLEKLNPLIFPVPPLEEQIRIADKVKELMVLCDQLESQTESSIEAHKTLVDTLLATLTNAKDADELVESWQRISEHFDILFTTEDSIDQLKQTILQLAVMGKLVKQDPNDEPASVLLERIAEEKEQLIKDKKIKKQKTPAPLAEADKPFDLPDSWEWAPFGTLIKSFANGLYKPSKFYTDDGCISLRMYNIQQGKIVFDNARRVEVTSEELETYKLEVNDLLINRVNSKELVGKTAIIPEHSEDLLYESMNMRAKPFKTHLSSDYLNIFMMSAIATKEIASFAKEAIGQASINQGQVSSIPTPLPPFNEQKKICEMVDSLFAICDRLNNEILSSKEIKSNLADSLKLEELA